MKKIIATAAALAALFVATGSAHAQAATYNIDPSHTFASFEVTHFGTSTIRGRFDKKEGAVQLDRAAKTGKVELTIDMASINTGVAPFDGHLKSKDFFDVGNFPTAKFVGDKFSFNGDKVTEVSGTLTLLGKTHPVTLKASIPGCESLEKTGDNQMKATAAVKLGPISARFNGAVTLSAPVRAVMGESAVSEPFR